MSPLCADVATAIIGPACFCRLDGLLLALLRATAQEDHESVSVLAKINPVPRSGIDLSLEYPSPNALHVRPVAGSQLIEQAVTRADATALSPSKQVAKGERSCGSRYSSTPTSDIYTVTKMLPLLIAG